MKSKGFTIIELLIVLVIIGILVTIVFVGFDANLEEKDCSEYGNSKVEDLPARCLEHFNLERGM